MRISLSKYFEQHPGRFQSFTKLISTVAILFFLVLLSYFIWALDRGFDINDESFYLLLAMYSAKVKLFVSAQHWITSGLWSCTGTLTAFRLSGLIILLFSSCILTLGAINTFSFFSINKLNKMDKVFVLVCTLSGALLYGATINFSPCYNLLASSGSYLAIGTVLFSINRTSNWQNIALCFLAGCAIGIIAISKLSAAMTVFGLTVLLIIFIQKTILKKTAGIAGILFGFALTAIIIAIPYLPVSKIMEELNLGLIVFKQVQSESSINRILRYSDEFLKQQFWSGMFLIIPITFLSIYSKFQYKFYYISGAIFCIILLTTINLPTSFRTNIWSVTTSILSAILTISLILTVTVWIKNYKSFIITAILFILPYAVSFGTGNSISTQIIASLASWSILISFLALSANFNAPKKILSYFLCLIFIFVITGHVIYKSIKPYHMISPIWHQNIPVKIGLIGTVRVDKQTYNFILTLDSISHNCKIMNNCSYLGLYDMPGVALIIGGIPHFAPWLTNDKQAKEILDRTDQRVLEDMILGISINKDGKHSKLPIQLSNFPNGYINCGELTYPWQKKTLQIWRANGI